MKKILLLVTMLVALTLTTAAAAATVETELTVGGMTCNSCVAIINSVLRSLDGVMDVAVNLRSGKVTVVHNSGLNADTIKDTIIGAGYSVTQAATNTQTAQADAPQDSGSPNALSQPVPSGYAIPTDDVAVAEIIEADNAVYQILSVELNDYGFSPAVAVIQLGIDTRWQIRNNTSGGLGSELLVPAYATSIPLSQGNNLLYVYPTGSFDFSDSNSEFYGYIKAVDDLEQINIAEIREEAGSFQTMIWPPEAFRSYGGRGGGCCAGGR